jgi:hypothetical protein
MNLKKQIKEVKYPYTFVLGFIEFNLTFYANRGLF